MSRRTVNSIVNSTYDKSDVTAHKCRNCSKSLLLEDTPFDVTIGFDTLRCIAERRSNSQTVRPAVDSSLGDTQAETAQHPVTVTQTVNARPTSSYESRMPRIYDDDGLGGEQCEVTAAYTIHETDRRVPGVQKGHY